MWSKTSKRLSTCTHTHTLSLSLLSFSRSYLPAFMYTSLPVNASPALPPRSQVSLHILPWHLTLPGSPICQHLPPSTIHATPGDPNKRLEVRDAHAVVSSILGLITRRNALFRTPRQVHRGGLPMQVKDHGNCCVSLSRGGAR
jgi:hypothetical protein